MIYRKEGESSVEMVNSEVQTDFNLQDTAPPGSGTQSSPVPEQVDFEMGKIDA